MPRSFDFKRLNLSHSEQAMIKKWSRVMVAIYASLESSLSSSHLRRAVNRASTTSRRNRAPRSCPSTTIETCGEAAAGGAIVQQLPDGR
jgi:hypothetical protein